MALTSSRPDLAEVDKPQFPFREPVSVARRWLDHPLMVPPAFGSRLRRPVVHRAAAVVEYRRSGGASALGIQRASNAVRSVADGVCCPASPLDALWRRRSLDGPDGMHGSAD